MHFHGWKCGLETGMYYLHTQPATTAVKVTVPVSATASATPIATPPFLEEEREHGVFGVIRDFHKGCFFCMWNRAPKHLGWADGCHSAVNGAVMRQVCEWVGLNVMR